MINFYDEGEARDRRLQMLINAANAIEQNKIARDELELKRQALTQKTTPTPIERSEIATRNRLRLAQARNLESQASQPSILDRINQLKGIQGDNIQPGTTIYDKRTGIRVPLNPKLTEDEKAAVAGKEKFGELINEVSSYVDKGVLNSGRSRAWTSLLAEGGGNPLLRLATEDNTDLEALASARSEIIKYVFSEGGKQLTANEKEIVTAGLSFFGKSDQQIKKDFDRAIDILRKKAGLTTGGMSKASEGKSESKPEKDTLGLFS